ncbi:hypothetical protein O9929_16305 [Vibrio lentus]|nr:hypothetical protein [Vibrio lentus]
MVAQAAKGIKRTSMELGGNAPFIVFDDGYRRRVQGAMASNSVMHGAKPVFVAERFRFITRCMTGL